MNYLNDVNAITPKRAYSGDAGLDLYTIKGTDVCVAPGTGVVIDTGFHVEIPEGKVGLILPRSSTFAEGLQVATGVIDHGYTGSLKIQLWNMGASEARIYGGTRLAQLVVVELFTDRLVRVASLGRYTRGSKGFGSTGRN